jgi:hypothetical protein
MQNQTCYNYRYFIFRIKICKDTYISMSLKFVAYMVLGGVLT